MKILFLTRYAQQGASSRQRSIQILPWFELAGISCVVSPLFDDAMLLQKYRHGNYSYLTVFSAYWKRLQALMDRNQFDLIWVEKEALPWFPVWFERLLLRGVPYCMDFDDALFHNYDLHNSSLVRTLYGTRVDRIMAGARLITAGNSYLAERAASAGATWVENIPTVVDLDRYTAKNCYEQSEKPRIVWIGSPSTVQYLSHIAQPLASLAQRYPFTLRVIGGETSLPGVDVELYPWSAETEAQAIAECDIGIMPLFDTPWERGKCAYKLIQYMACGLPTVSSPIGANRDVVISEETGYFAQSENDWLIKLEILLRDAAVRKRLGEGGRKRVEEKYCLQQIAPKLIGLLKKACNRDERD